MAYDVLASLVALQSKVKASGFVPSCELGEPKQPPVDRLHAGIYMRDQRVSKVTLASTIEVHTAIVRLYMNAFIEPAGTTETELARTASNLQADWFADYNLGDEIRNIDIAGEEGEAVGAAWGYVDVGGTMYRLCDITVPMIVDGSATPAQ